VWNFVGKILRAETEVMYSDKTLSQCHLVVMMLSATMIADIVSELGFSLFGRTGINIQYNMHNGEGKFTINLKFRSISSMLCCFSVTWLNFFIEDEDIEIRK
jgi:hypothetical protein